MFSGRLWELFIDSFPKILIPGLTVTIPLTVISFTFALIIAVIMALVQFANVKVLKQIARFYIWIFRGTPLLVQLFVVFFGLSRIGILLDPFPAAVIVFSLNEGAYCAETIRAALESCRRVSLKPVSAWGLPTSRPFSASCCRRPCARRSRRFPTRSSPWSRTPPLRRTSP